MLLCFANIGKACITQACIFIDGIKLIKNNLFCDKSFDLKSIFQKIEKKLTLLGRFQNSKLQRHKSGGVNPFRYNYQW